jgi:hypothetical protein
MEIPMSRTHEALRRAEANLEKKTFEKKYSEPTKQSELIGKIETFLEGLGLSEKQILNQNLREIRHSLKKIEACIVDPAKSLNIKSDRLEIDHNNIALSILVNRKKIMLNRYNDLVSKIKYYDINKLINDIAEDEIRSSLGKKIRDLYVKDKILEREHNRLDEMLRTINSQQHKKRDEVYTEIPKTEPTETQKKVAKESIRLRDSLGILILGILLGCLTLFIASAPFVGISVPSSLNIAFFVLIGLFLGLTIAKLARP